MLLSILLQDGIFAAIAAIGFGSISNVPKKIFAGCGVVAAMGHVTRFVLMNLFGTHIIWASLVAGLVIGCAAILLRRVWKCPCEMLAFPALLPMIPGMYAYRSVQSLLLCFKTPNDELFEHYIHIFVYNFMVCVLAILMMVFGLTFVIHLQRKRTIFQKWKKSSVAFSQKSVD